MCFGTDPYCRTDVDLGLTRAALRILGSNRVPVSVLTKGGLRCLRDLDVFRRFGEHIMVGATLTGHDELEPGAATNDERLRVLCELYDHLVPTWASFEPVIDPDRSLEYLRRAAPVCRLVKIGKINNWSGCDDKALDWSGFLREAIAICDAAGCRYYVKNDLWEAAGGPEVGAQHRDPDLFQAPGWAGATQPTAREAVKGSAE